MEPSRGEVRYLIWIPKTALKRVREKNVPVSGTGYSFRLRFKLTQIRISTFDLFQAKQESIFFFILDLNYRK